MPNFTVIKALYQSLIAHNNALKSLQREHNKHLEREKALGEILDALRTGYNPNYQDMAVLEAVRGWEELAGLPHINDVGKSGTESSDETQDDLPVADETLEEGGLTADELQWKVPGLLDTDYVSLMLEYEEFIQAPTEGSIRMFTNSSRSNVISFL